MGSCNTTQNEVGGKELLLKVCKEILVTSTVSATLTSVAHGLKVGDIIRPTTIGANTVIDIGGFYFVKTVPSADTFTISETRLGAAIAMDDAETGMAWDAFQNFGGLRSKSFSFNSEGIDITNQDSDEWKNILDGAGVRSFSVSGSGVYTNEDVFQDAQESALNNALICMMFIDVKASRVWVGCMKITSLEISGDYDAESNYSISAESSGAVTVQVIGA